ncbi:hypothetical protein [Limisphaera ngatamarikiensis]|uniref:hypothetical protein n=1 Tax=Limisphaera ngatamarikiensis TaxID=1324935 RepID=UPI001981A013|nr:hypothetical protein [Limisphaera ngatamarikiensis]
MRLRVLTHTFPPSAHPNAKRPFYVVRHALAEGWEVEVWTSPWGVLSPDAECLNHPRLTIRRFEDPVLRWQQRLRPHPRLLRWWAYLTGGLMFPDACAGWARKVLGALAGAPPADRTLAYVLPASLLMAGRLGRGVDRTWVFDYQEPVSPQQLRVQRRSPLQRLWRRRLAALERDTLHQVGRVLFTAAANQRAYVAMGLAPAARTAHVPYFYDTGVFDRPAPPPRQGFEVVYFGTFDWRGARSPRTFLEALAGFLRRHPEARAETRFRFHGQWPPQCDEQVRALGLEDILVRGPVLDHDRYLEEVRISPILLLVISPLHDLYMPSKIVDYLGARRPILALVPPGSEMHQLLVAAGQGSHCCDPMEAAAVVAVLERMWSAYRAGALEAPRGEIRFWSSEVQLPVYLEHLRAAPMEPAPAHGLRT